MYAKATLFSQALISTRISGRIVRRKATKEKNPKGGNQDFLTIVQCNFSAPWRKGEMLADRRMGRGWKIFRASVRARMIRGA